MTVFRLTLVAVDATPSALGWSVFRLDWPLALHSAVIAAVVARVGALMASTIMAFDVAQLEEVGVDL